MRSQDGEQIEFETYCRIEHVVSGMWLHAEQEDHERRETIETKSNNMSMAGLLWTTATLKKVRENEIRAADLTQSAERRKSGNLGDCVFSSESYRWIWTR